LVEHQLPKLRVAGSNPVSRSIFRPGHATPFPRKSCQGIEEARNRVIGTHLAIAHRSRVLKSRAVMTTASAQRVFTVGYQGRTIEDFLAVLLKARVDMIVDVRELPLSRARGFSKTPLREALRQAGIAYIHLRGAGNPFRKAAATIAECLTLYRAHVSRSPEIVASVKDAVAGRRAALLCVEPHASGCHRGVLGEQLRELGLAVEDL
jgi:hypothetical protein